MPVNIIKSKAAKQSNLAKKLALAAQQYREEGWHVFPITPHQKDPPLVSGWPQKATVNPQQIKEWWATTPEANLAVACGMLSGIVVMDVDVADGKAGAASLAGLIKKHGSLVTRTARSPTGGGALLLQEPR